MTKEELIELAQVGMGIHSPDDPEYVVCKALIKALEEQRTWVGLTDEEIDGCDWGQSERDFARAIEAKLRSKNYD